MSRTGWVVALLVVIGLWSGAVVLQRHAKSQEIPVEMALASENETASAEKYLSVNVNYPFDVADEITFVGHGDGKTAVQAFAAAETDAQDQADRIDEKIKKSWSVKYPYWKGRRTAHVEHEGDGYKATYTIVSSYTWRPKNEGGVK